MTTPSPSAVPMTTAPRVVGVSLKMYFGHAQTLEWIEQVGALARRHEAVVDGRVRLFVIPGYLAVAPSVAALAGTGVLVGAQDLASADRGAFTGEVGGPELAEVGVTVVEVGHAERRSLFGETDEVVAEKTTAALRNGLSPVLCIGEVERTTPEAAATECVRQLDSALADAVAGPVIVAYEPVWAIGAAEPASAEYVRAVGAILKRSIAERADRVGSSVIYGGSAGPGLLTALGDDVDGVFLGRFAHDVAALEAVLDEALRQAQDGTLRQAQDGTLRQAQGPRTA
ncbi:triosephosphate isomerase [Plantibacter sp. MCCC 1A11337]|uniref:triose-phosphate isomerase family protein n=1 Tax=Plantibacter sp. MCCC 1A11337 TaxID=2736644 RepID=UPI001584347E|nr:triose-phosphate isomerase family protein [Plantibacter sp. MCCC 1A11337]NUJ88157.1 triosephosphate isomerase [Plantibacter sp. MCCC 1A11337]